MNEQIIRGKIEKDPDNAMNYYYLGKELLNKPLKNVDSVKEIEGLFKDSIKLAPGLWAPRIMLGELLFKLGKYRGAEVCFRDVLKIFPESTSAQEYLARCMSVRSASESKIEEISERDVLYLFENNVRDFIRKILEREYGGNWWWEGIPQKVRAGCASKREEGLEEEKDADLLLFTDFRNYKEIIEYQRNKKLFTIHLDIKEWGKILCSIEPIRNAIAHNHPLPKVAPKIRNYYLDFQKILNKMDERVRK
jgi:tetratricopeptide (TPR) repeat protein